MRKIWRVAAAWLAFFVLLVPEARAAGQTIPLIDYNGYPPIIVDLPSSKGMLWDLAELLSHRSHGKYQFAAAEMPRKRLDIEIESHTLLAVPFVDPGFFGDVGLTKYLWTRPMFEDRQEIVSPLEQPVEYSGPDSLAGKMFGGVFGRIYGPLEESFKSGRIQRSDALDELSTLLKVGNDRVNVGTVSALALRYYQHIDPRVANLHVSSQPLYPIKRRIMVIGPPELRDFIDVQLGDLDADDWQTLLRRY